MRAIRLHEYGDIDRLRLEDVPIPAPAAGEVQVRVAATAVNPIDWRIRSGAIRERRPVTFPLTLGCDLSGVVSAVGEGVSHLEPGDEVFGFCAVQRAGAGDGAYAEYLSLPAGAVARKPRNLSMAEAAAIPLGALTAWCAMVEDGGLAKGQKILIHAAAGGVGSIAVQLAKVLGAQVFATASAASASLVRSLGADVVIDYQTQRFEEIAAGVDVVLDGVGGETQERSYGCLRPGGFMAALVGPPDPARLAALGLRGSRAAARPDGALLSYFAGLADAGALRPVIDRVLPLEAVGEGHLLSQGGHVHGKIVLQVSADAS